MVQHLLEFMAGTACAWPAVGSAQRAHVSV